MEKQKVEKTDFLQSLEILLNRNEDLKKDFVKVFAKEKSCHLNK